MTRIYVAGLHVVRGYRATYLYTMTRIYVAGLHVVRGYRATYLYTICHVFMVQTSMCCVDILDAFSLASCKARTVSLVPRNSAFGVRMVLISVNER
jgi:hypothetical protein